MWVDRLKGSFVALFFILLNIVYLVIELSFNARVLDLSAGQDFDVDFSRLEIYGRTISASGATILAWRLFAPYRHQVNLTRLVLRFFVIGMIVFPTVFIGQKKLVDDLVDLSSEETRRRAEILSLLKYGIANGFVALEGLQVAELELQTAEGKTFITLAGLLAYNANEMREVMERELDRITEYAVRTEQQDNVEALYRNYRYVREQVLAGYQRYLDLLHQLETRQAAAADEARALYENAMNRALRQWDGYRAMVAADTTIDKVESRQVSGIERLLRGAERYSANCASSRCIDETLQRLEFSLSRELGVFTAVTQWCQPGVVGSRSPLICVRGFHELRNKIIATRYLTLALQSGLSQAYADRLLFLKSQDMRGNVFAALRENGIVPNPQWRFDAFAHILEDIARQLQQFYLDEYLAAVEAAFGDELAPRSELEVFNRLASLQALYRQGMELPLEGEIAVDLTAQQLSDQIAPLYAMKQDRLLARLQADAGWYADDAPYEEHGKKSLRNLVVPPVALAFSLVFGLMNMIALFLSLVFVVIEERRVLRWGGAVIMVALVLAMPMRQDYAFFDQPAYRDLLAQTERLYPAWASPLDWLARTEPRIYPLANVMRFRLLHGFDFD